MIGNKEDKSSWEEELKRNADYHFNKLLSRNISEYDELREKVRKILSDNNYLLDYSSQLYNSSKDIHDIVDISYSLEDKINKGISKINSLLKSDNSFFLNEELYNIDTIVYNLRTTELDKDIFPWINNKQKPSHKELERSINIIAERLLEKSLYKKLRNDTKNDLKDQLAIFLAGKGYREVDGEVDYSAMPLGSLNITSPLFDIIIKPYNSTAKAPPIFIDIRNGRDYLELDGKRSSDFNKFQAIKKKHKKDITYLLVLSGYFSPYLLSTVKFPTDFIYEDSFIESIAHLKL